MGRGRALNLLKEGKGRLWEQRQSSSEGRKSLRYYPVLTCTEAHVPVQVAIWEKRPRNLKTAEERDAWGKSAFADFAKEPSDT